MKNPKIRNLRKFEHAKITRSTVCVFFHFSDDFSVCCSISASRLKDIERNQPEQVELDIKCLQILRAMIHNKERLLPEGDTARVARKREA